MRVKVDRSLCQGHGLCYFASAELFSLETEDGKAQVLLDPVPPALRDAALTAEVTCPEQAITVTDEEG
jgi:ferredoxin